MYARIYRLCTLKECTLIENCFNNTGCSFKKKYIFEHFFLTYKLCIYVKTCLTRKLSPIFSPSPVLNNLLFSTSLRLYLFICTRGGISFLTGGSFSTSWMWKMSPGKLPCPRTWNNIKKIFLIYLTVN